MGIVVVNCVSKVAVNCVRLIGGNLYTMSGRRRLNGGNLMTTIRRQHTGTTNREHGCASAAPHHPVHSFLIH